MIIFDSTIIVVQAWEEGGEQIILLDKWRRNELMMFVTSIIAEPSKQEHYYITFSEETILSSFVYEPSGLCGQFFMLLP